MKEIEEIGENDVIREIVEAEDKAALARFLTGHFQERLEQRIRSAALRSHRLSIFRVIPQPVWVSLAVLIGLGGGLLTYRILSAPEPKASAIIENCLRQLDGIRAIEKEPRPVSDRSSALATSPRKGIASVLFSPSDQSGTTLSLRQGSGFSVIDPKTKPMNLEEFYGLLIMNQSVERVLTAIAQKTKEV